MEKFVEFFTGESLLAIFGAFIGSMLRIMQKTKALGRRMKTPERWYEFFVSLGLMFITMLACDYFHLDSRLSAGIGFISCYAGVALLDVLKNALLNRVKNEIEKQS